PLLVFDGEFAIGAVVHIAGNATGTVSVPVRVRYQACDETACYLPVSIRTTWEIPAATSSGPKAHQEVFRAIKFGTGERATIIAEPPTPAATPAGPAPVSGADALQPWTIKGSTTGYQGASDFLTFITNAENGIQERGLFDGRGPLAILLLVLVGGL